MKLTIEINLDNAAFEGCESTEVTRILRGVIKDYNNDPSPGFYVKLRDENGNKVGFAKIAED